MYRPGQCIFKTGDGGEHFYIACAGQVNLSVPDTDNPDNRKRRSSSSSRASTSASARS